MKQEYYYEFIYESESFNGLSIVKFLKEIAKTFIPINVFGEKNDFDNNSLSQIENQKFTHTALLINGKNKDFFNIYSASQNRLDPPKKYCVIRFINKKEMLNNDELMYLLNLQKFTIGFLVDYSYHFKQSTDNPAFYAMNNLKYANLSKCFNELIQMELIDISNNPGRERFLPGMKFIPAFKIWYGQTVQNLFGKEKILVYPHAIDTKELANGVIEMQLMDKIDKCDRPYNQEKQRDIVKYFDIEKIEVSKY